MKNRLWVFHSWTRGSWECIWLRLAWQCSWRCTCPLSPGVSVGWFPLTIFTVHGALTTCPCNLSLPLLLSKVRCTISLAESKMLQASLFLFFSQGSPSADCFLPQQTECPTGSLTSPLHVAGHWEFCWWPVHRVSSCLKIYRQFSPDTQTMSNISPGGLFSTERVCSLL